MMEKHDLFGHEACHQAVALVGDQSLDETAWSWLR